MATFLGLEALLALQALLAYHDQFLTVAQMQARGVPAGLPLSWHFGIWSDALLLSGLAAFVVTHYSNHWNWRKLAVAAIVALGVTTFAGWLFSLSRTQEAFTQDGHTPAAGWVHLVYMQAAVSIFTLFFFLTPHLPRRVLALVSLAVVLHLFLGTHMALGLINLAVGFDWYQDEPLKSISGWTIIALTAIAIVLRLQLSAKHNAPTSLLGEMAQHLEESADTERLRQILETALKDAKHPSRQARQLLYRKARWALETLRPSMRAERYEHLQLSLEDVIQEIEDRYKSPFWSHVEWGLWLTGNTFKNVEGQLKTLDYFCNFIAAGVLFRLFAYKLSIASYFPNGPFDVTGCLRFLSEHGMATALLSCVMAVYFLSRRCVKTELSIVRQLFAPSRTPRRWTYMVAAREVAGLVLVYVAVYLGIAWFVDDVRIVAGAFVVIFAINFRNMKLTQETLRRYLSDPNLEPSLSDEHREFIMRRRRIAWEYIYGKPHLRKEKVATSMSAIALLLGFVGVEFQSSLALVAANLLMMVTLVGNEAVVLSWRLARSKKLRAIDDDQSISDQIRIREIGT